MYIYSLFIVYDIIVHLLLLLLCIYLEEAAVLEEPEAADLRPLPRRASFDVLKAVLCSDGAVCVLNSCVENIYIYIYIYIYTHTHIHVIVDAYCRTKLTCARFHVAPVLLSTPRCSYFYSYCYY